MWRKRKKKKDFRPLVILALALLLLFGSFFIIFKSNFLNIKKIDIQAINIICASSDQLKASTGILGQNFFLISTSEIENNLKKKFICIKSVLVSKFLPDSVRLQISSREALAVLVSLKNEAFVSATPSAENIKGYELVDSEGVIFGSTNDNLSLPQILVYNPKDNIKPALLILNKIKTLNIQINKALINQDTFIITSGNPVLEIFFRLNNNVDIQLASLQLILDKAKIDLNELEFIDLRFDKPVVRFATKK